jgi:hypothetical protein
LYPCFEWFDAVADLQYILRVRHNKEKLCRTAL